MTTPTEVDNRTDGRVNWLSVIIYYLLACAISWPFFWKRDILGEQVPTFTYMWGPGIAAIITYLIFRKKHRRTITFFGGSVVRSLLFYLLPIAGLSVALALTSGEGDGGSPFLLLFALPVIGFVNILGEELGWRGFLQDALRPLSPLKRYMLIGILWEFWHFTNRTTGAPLGKIALKLAISYTAVVILAWLIGMATERTKSVVVAVTFHTWVNVIFEYSGTGTYIVLALSVPLWFYLLKTWKREERVDDDGEEGLRGALVPVSEGG